MTSLVPPELSEAESQARASYIMGSVTRHGG